MVAIFDAHIAYVAVHCDSICVGNIVPKEIYVSQLLSFQVFSDVMVFLENRGKMFRVLFTVVFDFKVVNNGVEHDELPCVLPQSRRCCSFVVSILLKMRTE